MHHSRKPIVSCLAMFSLLALAGCGHGGSNRRRRSSGPTATAGGPKLDAAPGAAKDSQDLQHPVVCFETTAGNFTVRLDADKAPLPWTTS